MTNLVVVGLQFGDEGKGKIVDYLSKSYDIVARFQGGSNAGHTVKVGSDEYKFRLLPSGAVREKFLVIGNGVVVDPFVLINEIKDIEKKGFKVNLVLSDRAQLVTPYEIQIDKLQEDAKGTSNLGTTKSGIGPTYSSKVSRTGLRVADFMDDSDEVHEAWAMHEQNAMNIIMGTYDEEPTLVSFEVYKEAMNQLRKYISNCELFLNTSRYYGKKVLFEGAQGTLLDIDHGTYPYVTSSNCVAAQAAIGTGVSHKRLGDTLGVMKAYTTRIGTGPFPTEIKDSIADDIRNKGHEYGTVTGRPRRIGWLDLVAIDYANILNGTDELALTKLDVLSGLDKIKICKYYEYLDEIKSTQFPVRLLAFENIKPFYVEFDGWENIDWNKLSENGKLTFKDLPRGMKDYIRYIEEHTGICISLISLGAERDCTLEKGYYL
jgi:adenylosuccinate synthase